MRHGALNTVSVAWSARSKRHVDNASNDNNNDSISSDNPSESKSSSSSSVAVLVPATEASALLGGASLQGMPAVVRALLEASCPVSVDAIVVAAALGDYDIVRTLYDALERQQTVVAAAIQVRLLVVVVVVVVVCVRVSVCLCACMQSGVACCAGGGADTCLGQTTIASLPSSVVVVLIRPQGCSVT